MDNVLRRSTSVHSVMENGGGHPDGVGGLNSLGAPVDASSALRPRTGSPGSPRREREREMMQQQQNGGKFASTESLQIGASGVEQPQVMYKKGYVFFYFMIVLIL